MICIVIAYFQRTPDMLRRAPSRIAAQRDSMLPIGLQAGHNVVSHRRRERPTHFGRRLTDDARIDRTVPPQLNSVIAAHRDTAEAHPR